MCNTMKWKENTVEVRFRRDAPKMSNNEVFTFVEQALGLDPLQDLRCLQQEIRRRVIALTLTDAVLCEQVCNLDTGELMFRYASGDLTPVTLHHAGRNNLAVRVHDLPHGMPHAAVEEHLRKFGELVGPMEFDVWTRGGRRTGLSNGIRIVRMNILKHIPSYLSIGGCTAVVFYAGQPKTCARCSGAHLVKDCDVRPGRKTFASAAGGGDDVEEDGYNSTIEEVIVVKDFVASSAGGGGRPSAASSAANTPRMDLCSPGYTPPPQRPYSSAPSSAARPGDTPSTSPVGEPRLAAEVFFLDDPSGGRSSSGAQGPATENGNGSVVELQAVMQEGRVQSPVGATQLCWVGHEGEQPAFWPVENPRSWVQNLPEENKFSSIFKVPGEEGKQDGQEPGVEPEASEVEEAEGQGSDAAPGLETFRERSLTDDLDNACGQWEIDSNSSLNAESFASASSTPIVSLEENEDSETAANPGWSIVTRLSKGLREKAQTKAASLKMKRKRNSPEEKQQERNSDSKNKRTPNSAKPRWQ